MTDLGFVHRYVPPPGHGSPITLLLLHGTGGNEEDLLHLGRELSPDAGLLSPRGRVLENGMPRFFRRLAEGVFDIEDLTEQTHALAGFVADAARRYRFPSAGVVAVGYSNGANIAGSTLILHPDALAGAVLFRPMVPFMPETTVSGLQGKPILILAGERDMLVPKEETERLEALLKQAGADVELRWDDASHGLTGEEVSAARVWLGRRMFPTSSASTASSFSPDATSP
jgi:predicted esterase